MLRYKTGVKVPPKGDINLEFVGFSIPDGQGDWSGVRLKLSNDGHGVQVNLVPQAAFFDEHTGQWTHATATEIADVLNTRPEFKRSQMRIFGAALHDQEAIVAKLEECGVSWRKDGDLSPPPGLSGAPEMNVEVTLRVNTLICRCIAKYSLNHLAFACGSAFVLGSDFDTIRSFVRDGTTPSYPLVIASHNPILRDDSVHVRQTGGHILTVSWSDSRLNLIGQVSLFNSITYNVSLCRQFTGKLWMPIRNGLHYDVDRMIVKPMIGFPENLLPSQSTRRTAY